MSSAPDARFKKLAGDAGLDFAAEVRAMARYELAVEHDNEVHVSGHVPRVRGSVAVTGRVGAGTSIDEAQRGARLCTLRALAALRQALGTLARVGKVLRLTVYVQSAEAFTQQALVADAASDVLHAVLQGAAGHARTAVGAYQLPENAAVQIDMVVALGAPETTYSTF